MGADVPNYILAESADPIIYIYSMQPTKAKFEFGSIKKPNRTMSMDEFPTMDEAVFDKLSEAIEQKLNSMGIYPMGFVNLGPQEISDPAKMEELTNTLIDQGPYYGFTVTIMEWGKLSKQISKADGVCTLDMVSNPAFTIALVGDADVTAMHTVMGGKTLENAMDFLKEEIEGKGQDYFLTTLTEERDIEALINKNKVVSDLWMKESTVNESWPSDDELKSSKILVVCEDATKMDKFMKYATGALEKNYPFDYDMVTIGELNSTDLSKYKYVLMPKKKLIEKSKVVGPNGMSARPGETNTRVKSYTTTAFYYQMKSIEGNDVFLGPDPDAVTNYAMGNLPLALRRFMKVFSKS
ncbi:MAG: hypothetical protein HKN79_01370 [Flavobacteriales bacterium]|nr:hypothetical protein [Flavobacteriales bacterium]